MRAIQQIIGLVLVLIIMAAFLWLGLFVAIALAIAIPLIVLGAKLWRTWAEEKGTQKRESDIIEITKVDYRVVEKDKE